MNALELRNVSKRFGSILANSHVDLTVKKGEILAILGENGSGKTTLMNMISGIYHPDEGEIFVNGEPATISSPRESGSSARADISRRIVQSAALSPDQTIFASPSVSKHPHSSSLL